MITYSLKPNKKYSKNQYNDEYLNISNDKEPNENILKIDLKTINFENTSVELALNTLHLNHNEYHNMGQAQIIKYYNDKIKLTNNINTILALKIILKYKLKNQDPNINKQNGITVGFPSPINHSNNVKNQNVPNNIENKINSMINVQKNEFKIKQIDENNFKIKQIDKNTISENKINNSSIINSSEFDIDSIIKTYSAKKNQGFIN